MPLDTYGVLKGTAVARRMGLGHSRHYHIHVVAGHAGYRASVNVESEGDEGPSVLQYALVKDLQHPLTRQLARLKEGFTVIRRGEHAISLDYIRGGLFDPHKMKPLPRSVPGQNNDLNELIDLYVQRAIEERGAEIYVFGEPWVVNQERDVYFGFAPNRGLHNIHMNQGNLPQFGYDDGVWQDGGLILHYPREQRWVGIFLKFQAQVWHTDDSNGKRIKTY